eukprot:TRINITY_DN9443_c0_g2_i1.p1 TRINITY_DN9443_c0_g2~~TRINITY_DN9443_c0_g2_i1.p1  ORF type:complete len:117 (+),score=18.82 TRINITY_DN9443_c0_g2_i1:340-690(+)
MAPCRVIDITGQCSGPKGGDYVLQTQDIESHEKEFGILEKGTIVLVRTGWSRFYPDGPASYLGFDETVQGPYNPHTSRLRFPGIGIEAAKLLPPWILVLPQTSWFIVFFFKQEFME